uniref:Uncharacterized protein n=1 Tax=viral metagenome TaxID=1070528 RepID=A0A6M3JDA8_9ZZZZ
MKITPVKFHSYTSCVLEKIFESEFSPETEKFRRELIDLFNDSEIKSGFGNKIQNDNKIVFECEIQGHRIFYGFYDSSFSIGFSYRDENEDRDTYHFYRRGE